MSFYEERILPVLIHAAMRQRNLAAYRGRIVPAAEGRVLEIGAGSGLNFRFYGSAVTGVVALEPSRRLAGMAEKAATAGAAPVEMLDASAEAIPLAAESIDTVVTTWTLCSIPDVARALDEVRRVLKPGGRLLFVEHGLSPDAGVRRWQNRLTPAWKRIGGGCHLNRPIASLIEQAGFAIDRLETGYMPGPKPMVYMFEGSARAAPQAQ
jgi:ubiquinone/menaquinone biosynthesis C-methylase UbiE